MTVRVTRSKLVDVDGKIVQLSPGDEVPDGVVLDPKYTTEPDKPKPAKKPAAKKAAARKKTSGA